MPKYITADEEMYDCGVCGLSCAERELNEYEDSGIHMCPRCNQSAIIVFGPDHPLCVEEKKKRIVGDVPRDLLEMWRDEDARKALDAKKTMMALVRAGLQYERQYGVGE